MRLTPCTVLVLSWLVGLASPKLLRADEVYLDNGVVLHGQLETMETERVYLKLQNGGLWIARSMILKLEKGPTPWETSEAATARYQIAPDDQFDSSRVQRVLPRLAQRYAPDAAQRVWPDLPQQLRFAEELATQPHSFKITFDQLEQMSLNAILQRYLQTESRRLDAHLTTAVREARRLKVVNDKATNLNLQGLMNALEAYCRVTPHPTNAQAKDLYLRMAKVRQEADILERLGDPKWVADSITWMRGRRESQALRLSTPGNQIDGKMNQAIKAVELRSDWQTDVIVSPTGMVTLLDTLEAIQRRLRFEFVDDAFVRYDPEMFLGDFRFDYIYHQPAAVVQRFRFIPAGREDAKPVCDLYLFTFSARPNYGLLVTPRGCWYALINVQ